MKSASLLVFVLGCLPGLLAAASAASARSFDLTALRADDLYDAARGYGFEPGFAPEGNRPFYFSVAVPEGNYRVTVTFGSPTAATATVVRAEARRLMLEPVATAPGESATRAFIVNVRTAALPPPEKNAPGGTRVLLNEREQGSYTWDEKLTLEFNGAAPGVRSVAVEPVTVPTVFLLGDSTVTDQRYDPAASWGQLLPFLFQPDIAVANHAESGETLKSFLTELRLAKVLSQLQAGDWVFIQFGHNDEKKQWPQTYVEAHTTYPAYLRAYLAEIRLRGATPVLVTSPQRRTFGADGRIRNTHGDYPQVVRELAAAEQLTLIDLAALSAQFYEALGPERAPLAFNDGGKDATHHNTYGAWLLASAVATSLRASGSPLAAHLRAEFTGVDTAHPPAPESLALPPSPGRAPGAAPPIRGN